MHPSAFGAAYERDVEHPIEWWQDRIRSNIVSDHGTLQFAVAGNQLVGMTGIFHDEAIKIRHRAYLWGVYVRPDWRGLKLADALIDACMVWAQSQQLAIVTLAVAANNPSALRCYLRCGFSIYGVEPDALRVEDVSIDEFLMARRLQP